MMRCKNRIYGAEFSQEEIADAVRNGRLLSMEIEFSRQCNFNCIYCYVPENSSKENGLTREEICNVIIQARDLGARKIVILGGEPMLYPHIMEMVQFIRKQDLDIELFTNGTNITPSTAQTLFDYRVIVVLKVNTFDEKLQDMLSCKQGAYKQIWEALKNLKQSGYSSDLPMGISTVICRQNIDELVEMWKWLRDQNIIPYFEMITPQGKAKENGSLRVETERIREFFYQVADIDREKYGYHWEPRPPLVGGECLRHQFSCTVNSKGDVLPCVGVTIPVGNIREKRLVDIIRDSEVIQDLRNYKQTIKGPCRECTKLSVCYGCRGTAYQLTGDYLASDPSCWENLDRQGDIVFLPVETSRLVPHKPPMLMIERLIEVKERFSVSEAEISSDTVFLGKDGELDEAAYPEIISQAIAAQNGFKHLGNQKSKSEGFLLGIKNLEILGTARIGDKLCVSVYKVAKYGDFGIVKGEIVRGEEIIARGEIKIWHSEEDK
jgi:radical SAM protein with 4Fe4S-binding SPASM domain